MGQAVLSLIVQRSASWHASVCLSHPCRLAWRVHEDSLCEATSELNTASDKMLRFTSDLRGAGYAPRPPAWPMAWLWMDNGP